MPLIHSQPTIKGTQNNSGNPRFKTLTNQPTKSQAMKQFTISIQSLQYSENPQKGFTDQIKLQK